MNTNIRFSKSDLITVAGIAMRPLEIDDKGGLFERLGLTCPPEAPSP